MVIWTVSPVGGVVCGYCRVWIDAGLPVGLVSAARLPRCDKHAGARVDWVAVEKERQRLRAEGQQPGLFK